MAAHHLVHRLINQQGQQKFAVSIVSEEATPPYDRVNLAKVLEGEDVQNLYLHPQSWYDEHNIDLYLGDKALSIDTKRQRITTETNTIHEYTHLVFATGSAPYIPPIPGIQSPGVFTYRTLKDIQNIMTAVHVPRRVMIVGGGLLGLETGRVLIRKGCAVEIIEAAPRLLPRQLDLQGAALLESQIRRLGIKLDLQKQVINIEEKSGELIVALSSGVSRKTDLIIIAAGTRPTDTLAKTSGVKCHPEGGIIVNDKLQTSVNNVWAIGECVRHQHKAYGFVSPCHEMADVLADRLLGTRRTFKGALPSARLKVEEVDIVTVGDSLQEDFRTQTISWVGKEQYRRVVLRDKRIVGAISIGASPDFPHIQMAVANRTRPSTQAIKRFKKQGQLFDTTSIMGVREWPDNAIVCTCTGVTCGRLRSELTEPNLSTSKLSNVTGAGTVCGSCKPLLVELVTGQGTSPSSNNKHLAILGSIALAAISIGAFNGPIPMSTSVQQSTVDVLWRESLYRQISGWTLLTICLCSLLLSLRKRSSLIRFGSFNSWRTLHAVLGVSALIFTGLHTGFRLGENINFLLMLSFLTTTTSGSVISFVMAIERTLPPSYSGWIKKISIATHIFLFWPWPILVFFHILSVYYY